MKEAFRKKRTEAYAYQNKNKNKRSSCDTFPNCSVVYNLFPNASVQDSDRFL